MRQRHTQMLDKANYLQTKTEPKLVRIGLQNSYVHDVLTLASTIALGT